MLYRNSPSVIVGKHQNTLAEVDMDFVNKHGIKVVRRLSGGGAVYHDLGNLNFTFIRNGKEGKLVDFKGFTQPIISALDCLGVKAQFQGHNSLMVNGKKVSGNAEHVFRNRVMHHGTLLYQSNLNYLGKVLYVNKNRYDDKAIKSVRADVGNIIDFIPKPMPIEDFTSYLHNFFLQKNSEATEYSFLQEDIDRIEKLCLDKYTTWTWNFGYSPRYSMKREITTTSGNIDISLEVDRGIIIRASAKSNSAEPDLLSIIEQSLAGCYHEESIIRDALLVNGIEVAMASKISKGIF